MIVIIKMPVYEGALIRIDAPNKHLPHNREVAAYVALYVWPLPNIVAMIPMM